MESNLLTETVWSKAKKDTRKAFHSIWFWVMEGFFVVVLSLIAFFLIPLDWSVGLKNILQIIAPFAAMLLGLELVFIFNICVAPIRQRDECRQKIRLLTHHPELQINRLEFKGIDVTASNETGFETPYSGILFFTNRLVLTNRSEHRMSVEPILQFLVQKDTRDSGRFETIRFSASTQEPISREFHEFIKTNEEWSEMKTCQFLASPIQLEKESSEIGYMAWLIHEDVLEMSQEDNIDLRTALYYGRSIVLILNDIIRDQSHHIAYSSRRYIFEASNEASD